MTHFNITVVVPEEQPVDDHGYLVDIGQYFSDVLSRYDENRAVNPYREYLRKDEYGRYADIETLKKEYANGPDRERDVHLYEALEKLYAERGAPREDDREGLVKLYRVCNGTELHYDGDRPYVMSEYNPESKFDFYEIGGRWAGMWKDILDFDDEGVVGRIHHLITAVDNETVMPTRAIVTPDGEWKQRCETLWWAMEADAKDPEEWRQEYLDVLRQYSGDYVVLLDAHI